jgi:hypothetical protein
LLLLQFWVVVENRDRIVRKATTTTTTTALEATFFDSGVVVVCFLLFLRVPIQTQTQTQQLLKLLSTPAPPIAPERFFRVAEEPIFIPLLW